jgi:hypothetical protein
MAESSKPNSGGGCLGKLVVLILLLAAGGLGAALFFIAKPQDLSDIGGYGPGAPNAPIRDMRVVLKASLDRGHIVNLTETELNQWLKRTLATKQGGPLGSQVSLDRVWVRLHEGYAEVIMERTLMGKPFTTSMFLRVEQLQGLKGVETRIHLDGGPFHANLPKPPRGGRFGSLVVPQGFLILVMPAYEKLAALFQEEKRLGFEEMARIHIEKGKLVLNPREPDNLVPGNLQNF